MTACRLLIAFMEGIFFVSTAFPPAECLAREIPVPQNVTTDPSTERCTDLKVVPRLPMSAIVTCDKGESMAVTLPLKPDARGYAREKSVRGNYEFREYRIPQGYQQEQAFEHLMSLLPTAGFTVKFSASPSIITARKQDIWVLFNISGEYYDAKVVRVQEDPWTPVKNTQEISREMETHNRVAIYGIEFSPDNQTVVAEHSEILGEILTYLKGNPGLTIDVESHRMSENGNAENDLEITRKRVQAVVAWLEAHGMAAGRLRTQALGRTKPITENDTPLEIQRNERIELAKSGQ
jgi:outer membrane protein OmpA-like peptidoglycan-associated protein